MSTRCGHRVWSGPRAPCAVAFDAPDTADAARGSRKDAHRATHVLLESIRSLVISSSLFLFFFFFLQYARRGLRGFDSRGAGASCFWLPRPAAAKGWLSTADTGSS